MHLKQVIVGLLLVVTVKASDFTPPPEAISLEDSRMAEFYSNPENRAVITGKFVDLPAEYKSKIALTWYAPKLLGNRPQSAHDVQVAEDGSFRIECESGVPMQKGFFQLAAMGPIKGRQMNLVLTKNLFLELRYLPDKKMLAVSYAGEDRELNETMERSERYEAKKVSALMKRIPTAAKNVENFDAALADINAAKQEMEEMLQAFAPGKYGWVLQQELDARYVMAVLATAFGNQQSLENRPEWGKIMEYKPYLFNRDSQVYYSYLDMYLDSTMESRGVFRLSDQELQSMLERRLKDADVALKPACEELIGLLKKKGEGQSINEERQIELRKQLSQRMMLRPDGRATAECTIRRFRDKIPVEKLDFVLLKRLPQAPEELLEALQPISEFVGERWLRLYIDSVKPRVAAQTAEIEAVLAKVTTQTVDDMGAVPQVLPSGAKLYKLPELSGADLLARIKNAARGKALIIDFWGPWCGPCMQDLPHSEKAHAAIKDAPVEFIYFGCRTNEAQWKEAIARLGLSGTHFLLTAKQDSELMSLFKKSGYPAYILINRKGKVQLDAISRFQSLKVEELRRLLK